MRKKTEPRTDTSKRLRPLGQDDLKAVSGGIKDKPGEYSTSSGGGGKA